MIKALWFLIKLTFILGAILWIAEHPGNIAINWMDYTFTLHLGVFAAALFGLIFVSVLVHRVYTGLTKLPHKIQKRQEERAVNRGYLSLTKGLAAVAAGDTKTARKCAKHAKSLLEDRGQKDSHALALLLTAQTAQLEGKTEDAQKAFKQLADHKDGAFLGIRGLLRSALDQGNLPEARRLIDKAIAQYPKQPWILKTAFEIDLRRKDWSSALERYMRLGKLKKSANDNETSDPARDVAALHTAYAHDLATQNNTKDAAAHLNKALKAAPDFIPAALALTETYIAQNKRKKAVQTLEKIWRINPHPALGALWLDLIPEKKKDKASMRMGWIEHLVILNTGSIESHLIAAHSAMAESLWGEARSYLERALTLDPDTRVYEALIKLEQDGTRDLAAIDKWKAALRHAPPAPAWVCGVTGRIFDQWYPVVQTSGEFTLFNTIHWQSPADVNTLSMPSHNAFIAHDAAGL